MPGKERFAQAGSAVSRGAAAAARALWQAAGMVLEVALIEVRAGEEEAFSAAYRGACGEVGTTPGCRSIRLTRGVESPSRFVLLVEWDSIDAHLRNFRATDRFVRWRQAVGPYFASPPTVEHFIDVAGNAAEPPG
jgi:heme-degrading monooxygenase HmoA